MPRLHLNRTGGARRGISYVGISERSTDARERAQKRARRAKKKLVQEANLLAQSTVAQSAQSTDWKVAGERWAVLHRRWKAAGSAGPHEERLWKSFKAATDQFHQRRTEHFAEIDRLHEDRASAKEQLIAEAEQLSSLSDYKLAKGKFDALMERWREIGSAGAAREQSLWERFTAAKQAMYDATAEDRRSLQSEYIQRVSERIQHHRETIDKLKSQKRELALRRRGLMPGWVGEELAEELDEHSERIDRYVDEHERWMAEDVERQARAMAAHDDVSVTDFYQHIMTLR